MKRKRTTGEDGYGHSSVERQTAREAPPSPPSPPGISSVRTPPQQVAPPLYIRRQPPLSTSSLYGLSQDLKACLWIRADRLAVWRRKSAGSDDRAGRKATRGQVRKKKLLAQEASLFTTAGESSWSLLVYLHSTLSECGENRLSSVSAIEKVGGSEEGLRKTSRRLDLARDS